MLDHIVTPEIANMVGNEAKPVVAADAVSTSEVRRWVIATLDDSPLWYDEDYANSTRFGAGCAPGPFPMRSVSHWKRRLGTPDPVRELDFDEDFRYGDESMNDPAIKIHWPDGVGSFHAGNEVEYIQFPWIGDVITIVERIVDIEEKQGRSGMLVVIHHDRIYTNQDGDLLIIDHGTGIAREMPAEKWAHK